MSADSTDIELRIRLRQQEILAALGTLALRGGTVDELLQEATHMVAQGLETQFCKVLEYRADEHAFLVRAGVGWQDGVVGQHGSARTDHPRPATP
jgi:competence protein ComGF